MGHSLRCGDRKNRTTAAPWSTDMHDRVKPITRRQIPAVGRILEAVGRCDLPRPVVVDAIRRKLSRIRAAREVPDFESIVTLVRHSIDELRTSKLQPIIYGTGIVIHTNFGRVPIADRKSTRLNSSHRTISYAV